MAVVDTGLRKFTDGAQHTLAFIKNIDTGDVVETTGQHGIPFGFDIRTAIGIGIIPDHTLFRGFGYRTGLTTAAAGNDCWTGTATTIAYPNQSVGEQMVVVSTSVNDVAVTGSGIRTISIHYIDAAGNEQEEIVSLNGTTPVNTVATNIRFVNYAHAHSVGSFGAYAAGTITIYKVATPTTVYTQIDAGMNMTLNSARMIPTGFYFMIDYITVSGVSSKPLSVRLRATCDDEGTLTEGIFLYNEVFSLQDSAITMSLTVPRRIPALAIVKGTVYSSQAGGEATLSYGGWLEPV